MLYQRGVSGGWRSLLQTLEAFGPGRRLSFRPDLLRPAARFIANRKQEAWHDETLWMVRAKRDKMSHSLPGWERLRELACDIKMYSNSHLDGTPEDVNALLGKAREQFTLYDAWPGVDRPDG